MIVPLLLARTLAEDFFATADFFMLADAVLLAEDFVVADFFSVDFLLFEVDFETALLETLRVDFVEEAIFIL